MDIKVRMDQIKKKAKNILVLILPLVGYATVSSGWRLPKFRGKYTL